jgi:hypothetical protein
MTAHAKQGTANVVVESITKGLEVVGGMELIEQGLNTFMEGMPVLMNALDEVAKLHPYVSKVSFTLRLVHHPYFRFIGGMYPMVWRPSIDLTGFSCRNGFQGRCRYDGFLFRLIFEHRLSGR